MFSTLKQRLILGIYLFLILSIPVGAYLASQITKVNSSADNSAAIAPPVPKPTLAPAQELLDSSQKLASKSTLPTPTPEPEEDLPTTATSFGPTLALKVALEGRPANDQATRLFVGIVEGVMTNSPKFLLSFTVDLPKNGEYANLSLAGLTPGSQYSALLKGSAQIATSSAFYMSPSQSNLNDSQALTLLSGDLNDDNTINDADYALALKALGSSDVSDNWNGNADLNKDKVVNTLDLIIIKKNIGKIGASGIWSSPIPVATPSAQLSPDSSPIGGPPDSDKGHWIWVPSI